MDKRTIFYVVAVVLIVAVASATFNGVDDTLKLFQGLTTIVTEMLP